MTLNEKYRKFLAAVSHAVIYKQDSPRHKEAVRTIQELMPQMEECRVEFLKDLDKPVGTIHVDLAKPEEKPSRR